MNRKTIPFWKELMTELEKEQKAQQLFDLIALQWEKKYTILPKQPIFIFVPDPANPFFKIPQGLCTQILSFEWGVKGKGYIFLNQSMAKEWTSTFFELKADLLYVFAFERRENLEVKILKDWVEQVLIPPKEDVNDLPLYVLLTFDWGDLVEN